MKRPWLSGFCSPDLPHDSHERCDEHPRHDGKPCACICHEETTMTEVHTVPTQQERGGGDELGSQILTAHPVITEPGLVYDMDDETYHADPVPGGSLSSTFARLLTRHVPAKAVERRRNRKPTKAMNLGKAVHAHALGAGPELIVWEYDGRTKDGKAERAAAADLLATEAAVAVTEAEHDQILSMVAALHAVPEVYGILAASRAEVSGFWCDLVGDVWCRARYDLLGKRLAYDYKTCEDATRRGFSKHMGSYGYHQQAEFYQRGLVALGHPAGDAPMQFICQETEPPYLVQIHTPDEVAMEVARDLNDRAIEIYAEGIASGTWPGYEQLHAEPAHLPGYYFYDNEAVLPEHWRAGEEDMVI